MKLDPFVEAGGAPFSLSRADALRERGRPSRAGRNEVGLDELDYDDVVYRFQDGGRLEEITMEAEEVTIGDVTVPFGELAAFIRGRDPQAFERAGFLVSPEFGLAFVPDEPFWVTALARHCLPQWRALGHS